MMRHRLRTSVTVIAIAVCCKGASGLAGQSPESSIRASQMPRADATVATAQARGRVVDGETGRPLRHVLVRIFSSELREMHSRMTDDQGRFEFAALPPSHYRLVAQKDGYLSVDYGQTRPGDSGKALDLRGADKLENLNFSLSRGAVITGRIVDEYGDPAVNIKVRALRYVFEHGEKRLTDEAVASTDDLGEYRLDGLVPARYYVSAAASRAQHPEPDSALEDAEDLYVPTYYPGSLNATGARTVTLALGQIVEASFQLVPARASRLSGTAVNSHGQAMTEVEAYKTNAMFGDRSDAMVGQDGSFTIVGLAPGDYQLRATGPSSRAGDWEVATALVGVTGSDIKNLRLTADAPVLITGRVVADPPPGSAVTPGDFRVVLDTIPIGSRPERFTTTPAAVLDDWTFILAAPPDTYSLEDMVLPAGWFLEAVQVDTLAAADSGIVVKPNEELHNVEIRVTNRPATISGTVVNARGQAARDYVVIIFPRDDQRWTPRSRYVLTAPPDQDGRFTVTAPARADYLAVAVESIEPGAWTDPDVLKRLVGNASAFSLTDGETRTLTLKIVSAP